MKNKYKFFSIIFVLFVALILFTAYFFTSVCSVYGNPIKSITIENYHIRAEVVSSAAKRELGLGKRSGLCATCGMLFVFENKDRYSFWMKDMEFPIDIIWIADESVVHIERNVSHIDQQKTYTSTQPANMVLELPAGTCEREGVKMGSHVVLK